MYFQDIPPANIMQMNMNRNTSAEPASPCIMMIPNGTRKCAHSSRKCGSEFILSPSFEMCHASDRINASLSISDGWIVVKPRLSHARSPALVMPSEVNSSIWSITATGI